MKLVRSEFGEILRLGESLGIYDVALPFMLVFAIAFAILQKINIFGDNKAVSVVIAMVLGLLAVRSEAYVNVLNKFLPNISLFLVVIIMLLLLVGTMTGKIHEASESKWIVLAFIIAIVFVVISLLTSIGSKSGVAGGFLGDIGKFLGDFFGGQNFKVVGLLIVIGGIIWLVSSFGGKKEK